MCACYGCENNGPCIADDAVNFALFVEQTLRSTEANLKRHRDAYLWLHMELGEIDAMNRFDSSINRAVTANKAADALRHAEDLIIGGVNTAQNCKHPDGSVCTHTGSGKAETDDQ